MWMDFFSFLVWPANRSSARKWREYDGKATRRELNGFLFLAMPIFAGRGEAAEAQAWQKIQAGPLCVPRYAVMESVNKYNENVFLKRVKFPE